MLTRVLPVAVVSALLAGLIGTSAAPPAAADPLPATYSASTHGDTLGLSVTGAGLTIGAALGHSATDVDSTAEPRAHAESSNLEAGAIGTRVAVPPAPADPDNTTPPKRPPGASPPITAPPLFSAGAVTGTGSTTWAGDAACVPDGVPIAQSTTSLAGATVGVPGVQILNLGAVQASGSTTLQDGSVVAASSGNLANFSMINGLVGIAVLTNPTLTATSDGTTGTVTANDYGVSVTAAGQTTTLTAGLTRTINLSIPFVATVSLTISVGQLNNTSSGATASGSMTFLNITGSVTSPFGGSLASFDFDLLPLSATATGAPGGVEFDALDPPVITSPATGETTGETPTITGTGVPGATVTVTEGGTVIGTAAVGAGDHVAGRRGRHQRQHADRQRYGGAGGDGRRHRRRDRRRQHDGRPRRHLVVRRARGAGRRRPRDRGHPDRRGRQHLAGVRPGDDHRRHGRARRAGDHRAGPGQHDGRHHPDDDGHGRAWLDGHGDRPERHRAGHRRGRRRRQLELRFGPVAGRHLHDHRHGHGRGWQRLAGVGAGHLHGRHR